MLLYGNSKTQCCSKTLNHICKSKVLSNKKNRNGLKNYLRVDSYTKHKNGQFLRETNIYRKFQRSNIAKICHLFEQVYPKKKIRK